MSKLQSLPSGTVTFLFTDIEGSTNLLNLLGADRYGQVLADQRNIVRSAFEHHDGTEIDTQGDAFFASFPRATQAVTAVVEIQRNLADHDWPEGIDLLLRMGLHTGEPVLIDEGYVGMDIHRAARIAHIGHGGQVLLSRTTADLVRDTLPEGTSLLDMGTYRLKDIPRPEPVSQLAIEGLLGDFPELKARQVELPVVHKNRLIQPAFMEDRPPVPTFGRTPFVARTGELAKLDWFLKQALAGHGQIVFITGGPGRGKTALMNAFARREMKTYTDLLVILGACNAYTGVGDPFHPFRDVLAMLTGDVEELWASGVIQTDQARRLWQAVPISVRAITEHGPELVDTFLPGKSLLARAEAATGGPAGWLEDLRNIVKNKDDARGDLDRKGLLNQYDRVLRMVVEESPILMTLDDLQWADAGSLDLLSHLGRRLEGKRLLIVATYRPEEVALGRGENRHPLEKILTEFKRQRGDVWIQLSEVDETEGQAFIDAYIDTEPNKLSLEFRQALFEHTSGHPLFTVELMRNLQERGDLIQDESGKWIESTELEWGVLPARVEGVIEERISRLEDELQTILTIASVEGETFTAEVVARVRQANERKLVQQLSQELDKQHRLVSVQALEWLGQQPLSLYQFRHHLFQHYLYHHLAETEQVYLHREVGQVLETLYGDQTDRVAVQLARHFDLAGLTDKAVEYYLKAGRRAGRLSAGEEAIENLNKGLNLLKTLPITVKRNQQELDLQIVLGNALIATKGYSAPEVKLTYDRARELCHQVGDTVQLFPVLYGLWVYYHVQANHPIARDVGKQFLHLAEQQQDEAPLLIAHRVLGLTYFCLGDFLQSKAHIEQAITLYDSEKHRSLGFTYGQDPGVVGRANLAWTLYMLGYPIQAKQIIEESLRLAQTISQPLTTAYVLSFAVHLYLLRQEGQSAQKYADDAIALCTKRRIAYWLAFNKLARSAALLTKGQAHEEIIPFRRGLAAYQDAGAQVIVPYFLSVLARVYRNLRYADEGLTVIADALGRIEKSEERYIEAELHRLKGELLGIQGKDETEQAVCYWKAINVARHQSARLLELRATVSLCRLWQVQGKTAEARQMLTEIYGWFTEGFDTVDLKEAKTLLKELS